MKIPVLIAPAILLLSSALLAAQPEPASSQKCEALARLNLPNVTITTARTEAAGEFNGPRHPFTGADISAFYKQLPAFCRVVAKAHPSSDSDITIEVWLPLENWNGKLQGLANGGFAGAINYLELGASLKNGYVATGTDTGHAGSPIDAAWALGHPEKIIDFGYRGIHEMTRVAKLVIPAFYGSAPKRSYFAGCSDGGREALMEAQRYPEDYDGILAGAPANYWTGLLSLAVFDTQAVTSAPASFIPPAKITTLGKAVVAACDKLDGVADGVLNDPRQCHFDPASIQCKDDADSNDCLTVPQVAALKTIYAGIRDAKGRTIFPGYLPGAEEGPGGWALWITGPAPAKSLMAYFGLGYYANMVYDQKDWDYKTFAVDSGMKMATGKTAEVLNATNPDLSAFRSRGGKLILYHGWNDPAIPALNTINYYQDVIAKMGRSAADSFTRLYMVPGMQHCGGGPGPDSFGAGPAENADPEHSMFSALEKWVEHGKEPKAIIATKYKDPSNPASGVEMTRPLCPYPEEAKYKDSGDTNQAANFVCTVAPNR